MPSKTIKSAVIVAGGAAAIAFAGFNFGQLPLPGNITSPLTSLASSFQSLFAQSPLAGIQPPAAPDALPGLPTGGSESPIDGLSILNPEEAAAALTALIMGEQLPAPLSLEVLKFLRDFGAENGEAGTPEMGEMSESLTRFLMGTLASAGAGEMPTDRLPALPIPFAPSNGGVPSLNDIFTVYGIGTTVSYLVAAYAVPDLGPWVLPHNIRVISDYVKINNNNETTGQPFTPFVTSGMTVGRNFTITNTTDVDAVIATALDQHTVNDVIVIQAPLSISIAFTTTCTRVTFGRCTNISFSTSTTNNDKVLARDASYTFAYPLNAGQFPTRATAMDLFQVVYDALGTLHAQKPREATAASPFAQIPGLEALVPGTGLADLSTQAPKVNFYGAQVSEGSLADTATSRVLGPLLSALRQGNLDVRRVAASSEQPNSPLPLPVSFSGSLNGQSLNPLSLVDNRLGVTAGYRVDEVRAGKINIMAVRWHNIGTETLGRAVDNVIGSLPGLGSQAPAGAAAEALKSSPATFYYDVPAGEYVLSDERVEGTNSVFATDYAIAGTPPTLSIPPQAPNLGDLQSMIAGIQALLGGDGGAGIPGFELPDGIELPQ
jgi:hypothetical protein